jgi:polyhydroxyalkanoate synthesis regulator phasin
MDRIITKTLGEIYLQQGHFQEAYEIFKALSEKDPFNAEIQKRLNELSKKLGLSSAIQRPVRSNEEKIRFLERWLANIQKRRKG